MSKFFYSIFSIILFSSFIPGSSVYVKPTGSAPFVDYAKGEKLTYMASYGIMNALEFGFEVSENFYTVNGKVCNRVDVTGKSKGLLNGTFSINNLWRSYIDRESKISHRFYRNISEGKYRREEFTEFDQANNRLVVNVDNKKAYQYILPKGEIHDVISAYFFLRTVNFDKLDKGDKIGTYFFLDDKAFNMQMTYVGKEIIKTKFGKVKAIKIQPIMPEVKALSGPNPVTLWISDDVNKIPLKAEANLVIGHAELNIETTKGLKAPLTILKDKKGSRKEEASAKL